MRAIHWLTAFIAIQFLMGDGVNAETSDSLVARLSRLIADCDSQIHELSYISTVRERELRDDGSAKSVKVYRSRVYVRDDDTREMLEAMWIDGETVAPDKLADEQRKRDKERVKRRKERTGGKSDDDGNSRSQGMLEPLQPEHIENYRFPNLSSENINGLLCWKLEVQPVREDEKLVKGFVWIEQESGLPVVEEYELAKRPGPLKEFGVRLEHVPMLTDCAVPKRVYVHGRGKALLVIKFNFDAEVLLDSVQVNPGLPDSLFAPPGS